MTPSIIIVTHNSVAFIGPCLRSLSSQTIGAEVVVVDNGSTDGTADLVRSQFPNVKVITQPNLGFGAGCNRGAREAQGDVLAFLNPDTEAQPEWLAALIDGLQPGRIHTSQIVDLDDPARVQTLGLDLHYTGVATLRRAGERAPITGPPEEVPGFSGAAFAMMRSDFESLGGFDEGFFLYMEDVDLAWRARRAGMTIWGIPASVVRHRRAGRLSPSKLANIRSGRQRLVAKHIPKRVRRRLALALGGVRVLEFIATLRLGRTTSATRVEEPGAKLDRRPGWLSLGISFRVTSGPLLGLLLSALFNPILVLNGWLWAKGPR